MEYISLILNFALGSGLLGVMVFYSSKRREANAQASGAEGEVRNQEFAIQRQQIEFLSTQLHEAWGEVEKMQGVINDKRTQIVGWISQTKQLEIELLEQQSKLRQAQLKACYREECIERITNN